MAASTDSIASTTACGCSSWMLCPLSGTTSRVPFADSWTSACCSSMPDAVEPFDDPGREVAERPPRPRGAQHDQRRIVEQRPGRIEHRARLRCRPGQVEMLAVQAGVVLERPEILLAPDPDHLRLAVTARRQRSAEPGTHPRTTWIHQHDAGNVRGVRGGEHAHRPHGHRVPDQQEGALDACEVERLLEVGHQVLARASRLGRRRAGTDPGPVVVAGADRQRESVDDRVPHVTRRVSAGLEQHGRHPGDDGTEAGHVDPAAVPLDVGDQVGGRCGRGRRGRVAGRAATGPRGRRRASSEQPPSVRAAASPRTRTPAYRMRPPRDAPTVGPRPPIRLRR